MLYDVYEILGVMVVGGFLAMLESAEGRRVSLWQFVGGGYLFERGEVTPRTYTQMLDCGIVEYWRNVENPNGQNVRLYFLVGQSPLSK